MRKEGEDQIHDQLRREIDQDQQSQKRIRDAVQGAEREKKHGRKVSNCRHGHVCAVAGIFKSFYF